MKVMEEGERTILGLMVASVRSSQFWLPSTYVWNREAGPHADVRVRNANVGATCQNFAKLSATMSIRAVQP